MNFTYTAQAAYDATKINQEEIFEKGRQELDRLIQHAVETGQYSVMYDRMIQNPNFDIDTKEILNQLGYKVTEKVLSNEKVVWIVSWETPGVLN